MTELYEEASERARWQDGATMVALCEKSPVAFLWEFLSKQRCVKHIPAITLQYRESPA